MEVLVLYDTLYGNTRQVAEAVGAAIGDGAHVEVRSIADAAGLPPAIDLLVVGGPTHRHGLSRPMRSFLAGLPDGRLDGLATAAFDTRLHMPRILTGSAAIGINRAMRKRGARLVAGPESFFVERDVMPKGEKPGPERVHLKPGEREHAQAWARRLAGTLAVAA